MSDITNVFKATVKTMKSRQKKQGGSNGPDKSILGVKKQRSEFSIKAKDVKSNITKLKDFLLEHRKDYLNSCSPLSVEESAMTDAQRDQIDDDAQVFMRTCSEAIKAVISEAHNEHTLPQVKEHREAACKLMEKYLKEVCKVYSEQRAIRVKRVVDRKRIGRLEPEANHSKRKDEKKSKRSNLESENGKEGSEEKMETNENRELLVGSGSSLSLAEPFFSTDEDEELSPEEAQMFEQENHQLYEEMNSLVDEVRNIEGKVVEISRLQEIFADKVLQQDGDIDRIADTVVGTTENIKEANEEIREAMKNNAGLRVWILFFLIVCSFSLLFLDWYNP